jgi:hypothetical protein
MCLDILGTFSPTSTKVSSIFILPLIAPNKVRGRVTITHMKITKITELNGRAAVELLAQAMLFNSIATVNKGKGKRIAVKMTLVCHEVPPKYLKNLALIAPAMTKDKYKNVVIYRQSMNKEEWRQSK